MLSPALPLLDAPAISPEDGAALRRMHSTTSVTSEVSLQLINEHEALSVRISCEETRTSSGSAVADGAVVDQRALQIQRWLRRCLTRRRSTVKRSHGSETDTYLESVEIESIETGSIERESIEDSARIELLDGPLLQNLQQHRFHRRSRSSGDVRGQPPQLISSSWVDTTAQLRVLLVFANPHGTSNLRLQAEERAIREALYGGALSARISLDVLPAATVDDLAKRLLRQQYDVIHFSGHADRVTLLMQHMIEKFRMEHGIDPASLRSNSRAVRVVERAVDGAVSKIEQLLLKQHPELDRRPVITGNADVIDVYGPPLLGKPLQQLYPSNGPPLDLTRRTKSVALPTYTLESAELFNDDVKVSIDVTIDDHKLGGSGRSYTVHQNISTRDVLDMGVGSLAFEGDSGELAFVRPESFARLLSAYCPPLRCVILNACGSKLQGGVLSQVVPLTVCFGCKVADRESTEFSKGFYDALGNGRSYEDAYVEGAKRMDLHALDPGVPFRPSTPVVSFGGSGAPEASTAIVSLFRNIPLLHELQHFKNEIIPPAMNQEIVVNGRTYTAKEIEEVMTMNAQLKSLVAYGMKVLESKDEQIASLKMQLEPSPAAPKNHRRLLSFDSAVNSPGSERRRVRTTPVKKDPATSSRRSSLGSEGSGIARRAWTKPPSPGSRISVAQRTTAASRAAQIKKEAPETGAAPSSTATTTANATATTTTTAAREVDSRRPSAAAGTAAEPSRTSPKPASTKRRTGTDGDEASSRRRQPSFGSRVPRFFDMQDSPNGTRPVVSVTYSPRQKADTRITPPKRVGSTSAPSTPPRQGPKS